MTEDMDNLVIDWKDLQPGTQIAYVPDHANGNLYHPDVQFGFVWAKTKMIDDTYFCRYWSGKSLELGEGYKVRVIEPDLRTKSCAEITERRHIVLHESVDQSIVFEVMKKIKDERSMS